MLRFSCSILLAGVAVSVDRLLSPARIRPRTRNTPPSLVILHHHHGFMATIYYSHPASCNKLGFAPGLDAIYRRDRSKPPKDRSDHSPRTRPPKHPERMRACAEKYSDVRTGIILTASNTDSPALCPPTKCFTTHGVPEQLIGASCTAVNPASFPSFLLPRHQNKEPRFLN